jgi:hypothetical protein
MKSQMNVGYNFEFFFKNCSEKLIFFQEIDNLFRKIVFFDQNSAFFDTLICSKRAQEEIIIHSESLTLRGI